MFAKEERLVALYALPRAGGGWLRFVGALDRLPIRPFWDECFSYEDVERARPETLAFCKWRGVDVLLRIHVQRNARGALLRSRLEEIRAMDLANTADVGKRG